MQSNIWDTVLHVRVRVHPTGISFTPKEVGEHVVSVQKGAQHVTNSPFRVIVGQSEMGDATRVKVCGQGLQEGHTFQVAHFIVDTRNAGEDQNLHDNRHDHVTGG